MGHIVAEIKSVSDVLHLNLTIPEYQRPYRWKYKNIKQLLEDIATNMNAGKQKYRIGSIILYKNGKNSYEIVDGQQRITSLLLIAKVCGKTTELFNQLQYKHSDSKTNIIKNHSYIQEWKNECVNFEYYWKYIENNCEFVVIVVDDLSEAFQMFDSQNGRGKELEAYNLLKAFHIRAMELEPFETKIACDKRWEAATMYDATPFINGDPNIDILRQLFNEQLYRGRIWSKGKIAHILTKSDIDEFKGFTIDKNHNIDHPFQNPYLLQYLTAKFYNNILAGTVTTQPRFIYGDSENINPFVSVTQQIVNGKSFFDYVETYVEIYKQLFIQLKGFQLKEFKAFFYKYCLNYEGDLSKTNSSTYFKAVGHATRSGDSYLREAYKTVILLLFDKFGEKGLNKYYKVLYKLIYCQRLSTRQVRRDTVAKLPVEYISIINQAKSMTDLIELEEIWGKMKGELVKIDNDIKGIECIKELLLNNQ